ncbi:hypothetical protein Trydic_g23005 [Trypoxylus dichotomus]
MTEKVNYLGTLDYVIMVLVLLISACIGVYYRFTGGKQKTVKEYLLADKNMHVLPVAFSLMASFMSAVTLLGVSSENYVFGIQFVVINLSYVLCTPLVAYLYLPIFYKLQVTSAYEYLEKRYGKVTRVAASLSYCLQMLLYQGIVLYAPALALEALTGLSKVTAILSVGLVCTFYSTIGGMKAVLITDVFQSLLMFAAVFSIVIYGAITVGGLDEIWRIATEGGRIDILNFNPDPTIRHTWFTLIIGGAITFLSLYGVNQTQVQRYMTMKDLKSAQISTWLQLPILSLMSLSTSLSGLAIYARYYRCDPVASGAIDINDQLMPYFVVDTMGHLPGLTGLFIAGLFSAALSTVSATINSLAAVTMEDYYKPIYKKIYRMEVPETKTSIYSKVMALCYGLICVATAFLAENLGGVLQASLTIFGVIGGPLLGLFSIGMFTTRANQKGCILALVVSMSLSLWMAFGQPRPPSAALPTSTEGCVLNSTRLVDNLMENNLRDEGEDYFWLYRVSYLYNGVFAFVYMLIGGYVFSFIIGLFDKENSKDLDPDLFFSPVANKLRQRKNASNNAELPRVK